jgi:hypothetical protein
MTKSSTPAYDTFPTITATFDNALANFRRVEKASEAGSAPWADAYDRLLFARERLMTQKAATNDNGAVHVLLALGCLLEADDALSFEAYEDDDELDAHGKERCRTAVRLLHLALDAFRKGGLLNVSDEMMFEIQPWRSPWLDPAEAERLRRATVPESRAT